MKNINILLVFTLAFGLFSCSQQEEKSKEVNIYTHRHYDVDKLLFDKFEEETGIKVNVVSASADELIMKLKQEGELSPADLLVTVDAGKIERAKKDGLLAPVKSELLEKNVLSNYRDADNQWFGISMRARIIAISKDYPNPEELTYAHLASEDFKGKVLMRSSDNIYNQSLVAAIIANVGEDSAQKWVDAVHANLARDPKGNDRDQIRAIAAGEGTISVVNSYYIGKMVDSEQENDRNAVSKVNFVYPNDANLNTHINVSAAGLLKNAPNRENAIKLLEFLTKPESQKIYYSESREYPINTLSPEETNFEPIGSIVPDDLPLSKIGDHQDAAAKLFENTGWM